MQDSNLPDPHHFKSAVIYEVALKESGWNEIGKGNFSRVYHRPSDNEVIKVSELDECYVFFAKYAKGKNVTALPKISVVIELTDWSVVHIEYLNKLESGNAFDLGEWWGQFVATKRASSSIVYTTLNMHWKQWTSLVEGLIPLHGRKGCGFDMKVLNAMQRSNGEIVFTDVLAET